MRKKILYVTLSLMAIFIISCDNNDDDTIADKISLITNNLQEPGENYELKAWIKIGENFESIGVLKFDNGELAQKVFNVDANKLKEATMFQITVEPKNSSNSVPSDFVLMKGEFDGDFAKLSLNLIGDFNNASGSYILATPTGDGGDLDAVSGIWFLKMNNGAAMASLNLPTLPEKWQYEGWVIIDGKPVTTGTFKDPTMADDSKLYSGTMPGPALPGEDFLMNAPTGLTFPVDLQKAGVAISIEPIPDTSTKPFMLKPLIGTIPDPYTTAGQLTNDVPNNFPTGSVRKL